MRQRFVIVYGGTTDPPSAEQARVVSLIKRGKVVDALPGTILVDGERGDVEVAIRDMPNWSFALEQAATVAPPHKVLRATAKHRS